MTLDQKTGLLSVVGETSALSPNCKLRTGIPRNPPAPGEKPRDISNDIWSSDLHMTPDGKFLYTAERTESTINAFRVDSVSGKLSYISSAVTEKQTRGFNIDPKGKFMVTAGELSSTISVFAIESDGKIKLLQKYPTGKDSTWVEIVNID